MKTRASIPFSLTILALMAMIVAPLAGVLLWLGWRGVDSLEQRGVDQRLTALNEAVAGFMTGGMRTIVSVGLAIAEEPIFGVQAGYEAEDERERQLVAVLRRHPALSAAYVGYDDGRFIYAGHTAGFSAAQRAEYGTPAEDAIIVRVIDGEEPMRRESWRFTSLVQADGEDRWRLTEFDPRERPWYVGAEKAHAPYLTEPYRFAWSSEAGITTGMPLQAGGGVIGFDFTLGTLAKLLTEYKITPNAIVITATAGSDVFMESDPCKAGATDCFPQDAEARTALRRTIVEAITAGGRLERDTSIAGRSYRMIVQPMTPLLTRKFLIAVAVPIAELTVDSRKLIERSAEVAAVAVALSILAVLAMSFALSRALRRISVKTERIRNLDFSDTTLISSRITEIARLSDAVERMREALEVFGRYVSKGLVSQIMRSPESAAVGGSRRELTVMFTDIESFSRISESIEPELLTSRLSRYFEALGSAISGNQGMIDKYIGDSVMAFWNAPEFDADHIAHACHAALQASRASLLLADKWKALGRAGFRTRIGVHTGLAVVGNVGARERINYTLVGAVANLASRLEGLNKIYGTSILASGVVASATASRFVWRPVDRGIAVGTTEVLEIYELRGLEADATETAFLERWAQGRSAYDDQRFAEAVLHFTQATELRPDDGPSRVFIQRCEEFLRDGVPDGWTGAWHFNVK